MGPSPYRGLVDTCVACGAELGVGRFCLNCGHRIGAPAPARPVPDAVPDPAADPVPASAPTARTATAPPRDRPGPDDDDPGPGAAPVVPPVQAADPTPVPPTSPPGGPRDDPPDDADRPLVRRTTWDPREDLLPYEEVDDVEGDLPVRGLAWLGWVVGAALVVGLAFVLLQVYDTDGDQVASDTSGDASTGTQAPAPEAEQTDDAADGSATDDAGDKAPAGVGKARDLTRGATFEVPGTAPPTTDFDGNLVAYEASQMGDRNPATAWRTAGDATGGTVTVTLNQPGVVNRVGLVNGYAKQVAGVDWYPNNRRILAVTWGFDDGSTIQQTLAERPDMQWLKVPPVETATVTVTIDAVTPPGSGNLGRDYTAISEVGVTGRRAG